MCFAILVFASDAIRARALLVVGYAEPFARQALIHGLQRHYYSIVIDYRKNELEEQVRWRNRPLSTLQDGILIGGYQDSTSGK